MAVRKEKGLVTIRYEGLEALKSLKFRRGELSRAYKKRILMRIRRNCDEFSNVDELLKENSVSILWELKFPTDISRDSFWLRLLDLSKE